MGLGKYKISKIKEEGQTFWHIDFPNGSGLNLPVEIAKTEDEARAYVDDNYSNDPDFTRPKKERDAALKALDKASDN